MQHLLLYTSPLHHALVGAIGALLTFLIIWGFRFLIAWIGNIKSKDVEQTNNEGSDYVKEESGCTNQKTEIISNSLIGNNKEYFCCHCGHQIEFGSHYCRFCGFPQSEGWNRLTIITKKVKLWLIVFSKFLIGSILAWCIGLLVCLLIDSQTKDVVNGWYYCLPPTIAFIFWFAFKSFIKKKITKNFNIKIISTLTIIVVGFWSIVAFYDIKKQKEKEQEQEELFAKQPNNINRTFYSCSLGESQNSVVNKLLEQGYDLEYSQSFGKDVLSIREVTYGAYNVERLSFVFIEKKLYLVSFKFSKDYWSELDNMLETMYSKFRKENNDYSDGKTTINIEYTDRFRNYRLRYYDNALLSKEIAKDKF